MMDQSTETRTAIQNLNERLTELFARGDAAAIAEHYSDGAQIFAPATDTVSGRAEIQRLVQGAMDLGVTTVNMTTAELEAFGDTAHEIGRYVFSSAEGEVIDEGTYVVIWKREDGEWRIHRDIWTSTLPAAE